MYNSLNISLLKIAHKEYLIIIKFVCEGTL
jgi:hypothetical protein